MPTYRFDLNEEYGKRLEKEAEDSEMTVQDYIRFRLFPSENIFTVLELVKRIKAKGPSEKFTIPDLYSDEEWSRVDRSVAGCLGKNFYKFISHSDLGISLVPNCRINRRAVYSYEGGQNHE